MSEMFIQDPLINEEEGDNEDPDDGLEERLTENTRIIRYDEVDNEITEISNLIASMLFNHRPTSNASAFIRSTPITLTQPANSLLHIDDFEMVIGSSETPRFSCACHKLNIVIQTAVESHIIFKDILEKLNSFAATSRNIIEINTIFNDAKCRPKLENTTRWFSQLYLLMWAKSCYTKNCKKDKFYWS